MTNLFCRMLSWFNSKPAEQSAYRITEVDGHWMTVEEVSEDGTVTEKRVFNGAVTGCYHDV